MKKFQNREFIKKWIAYLFMFSLGLTTPITVDITKAIYFIGVIVLTILYRKEISTTIRKNRVYFWGTQCFLVYILLLIIYGLIFIKSPYKPSFSDIEMVLTFYTILPLFALLLSIDIDTSMLKKMLFVFCLSIVINGLFILFYLYGFKDIFIHPVDMMMKISSERFTVAKNVLGKDVFVKDYSLFFGIAALISFYLFGTLQNNWVKVLSVILFLLNIILLLLCVTRGSIVGFVFGMIPLLYWFLRKQTKYKRIVYVIVLIFILCIVVFKLPDTITSRFHEIPIETNAFIEKNDASGSVSTRFTIWKIIFSHIDEFWLFGNNPLYTNQVLTQYLLEENHQDYVEYGHLSHNVYLDFWLRGGVFALLFLLFILLYPLLLMIKKKNYSYCGISIVLFFCIVGMEDRYYGDKHMPAILLVFLFLIPFCLDKFYLIENTSKS